MNIQQAVKDAVELGNWMLRRSDDGKSYGGFEWNPIGEWTEAPDWKPTKECKYGLFGNGPESSGFWNNRKTIDFCAVDQNAGVVNLDNKIKCRRAMVLLRNELPDNLSVGGFLDLEGTQITALPDNLSVGGSLDLRGTQITALPDNLSVGGFLDLEGTQITSGMVPNTLSKKAVF